jgi:hypothetical protein
MKRSRDHDYWEGGRFVFGKEPRELDQFFTKPDVVELCIEHLDKLFPIDATFKLIVEPSHGNMAFVDALNKYKDILIAMDIDSTNETTRRDFLQYTHTHTHTHTLVIGNPPFGRGSRMAVAFFNHAAKFAEVIAFIVPRTFRKASVTNKLDLNFEMIDELALDEDSFLFEGKDYKVPCVFQIWKRALRKRVKIPTINSTSDFKMIPKQSEDCDLVIRGVGVNAGRLYVDTQTKQYSEGSHRFISLFDKSKKTEVVENIKSLDLEKADCKYDVAGNPCLNASEFCTLYNQKFQ